MIKTLTDALKDILEPKSDKVECAIDESVIDCDKLEAPIHECGPSHFSHGYSPYVGVPAPKVLKEDEWFGPAPKYTDKQKDYMVQETEIKRQEFEKSFSVESEDIHQVMYEMATKSAATTLQLDPIGGSENFQGGSENVHR
jgi:hypothetical protein